MAKTIQEKLLQTPIAICQSSKEEHNHIKLTPKMTNPQQLLNPSTIDKKRTIWEADQKQRTEQIKYLHYQIQKNKNNKAAEIPNMDRNMAMTENKVTNW